MTINVETRIERYIVCLDVLRIYTSKSIFSTLVIAFAVAFLVKKLSFERINQ